MIRKNRPMLKMHEDLLMYYMKQARDYYHSTEREDSLIMEIRRLKRLLMDAGKYEIEKQPVMFTDGGGI